jgi:hypothetical protein
MVARRRYGRAGCRRPARASRRCCSKSGVHIPAPRPHPIPIELAVGSRRFLSQGSYATAGSTSALSLAIFSSALSPSMIRAGRRDAMRCDPRATCATRSKPPACGHAGRETVIPQRESGSGRGRGTGGFRRQPARVAGSGRPRSSKKPTARGRDRAGREADGAALRQR